MSSKDFDPETIVFPSVMNTDAQLPDWNNVNFDQREAGKIFNVDSNYLHSSSLYAEVRIEIVQANIYSAALYGRVME